MTQSPVTVTYSLEEDTGAPPAGAHQSVREVLGQINQKLDTLQKEVGELRQKDLADLKVGQARLEERMNSLETRFESMDKRIEKIENTQKNQVWTMITLLGGSLVTVALRFFLSSNNP